MARDAQPLPWRPRTDQAIPPRHRNVWIRLNGVWCKGWVLAWQRDRDGWALWTQHEQPNGSPWSWHEWFVYDEDAIRERTGDEPPDG